MTAPDPAWVEAGAKALAVCTCSEGRNQHGYWRRIDMECAACGDNKHRAAAVIAAVEPLIRADENMKVCRCGCMERDAHAEAVAAKLVEVICDLDWQVNSLAHDHREARRRLKDVMDEHDAARAEVAALRAKVKRIRVVAATNNAGSDVLNVLDEVLFVLIEEVGK